MGSQLLINVEGHRTRVALIEDGQLAELYIERKREKQLMGNIYKGKVTRVLPGMQAAFVDIGYEKSGFLFVTDMCLDKYPWKNLQNSLMENLIQEEGELDLEANEQERPSREIPIEDLLKEGQEIMVQVSRDPIGLKGPRLTCHVSLPGRHLVLMPTVNHVGVSKRIEDPKERQRLKEIVTSLRKNHYGYIVRTASEGIEEVKLKKEMEFLLNLWESISSKMERQRGPKLLYSELSVSLRAVRDLFTMDVDKLTIDSKEEYQNILEFIETFSPSLKYYVELYDGRKPLFEAYGIEHEINRALQRKVWLKSGGYIVIEPTEALTAIDVNTGSFTGKKNLEDTIFKTNMEAAKEIAYQLRLRNIGGIIVIDFIDMQSEANKEKLLEAFKEFLKKDRARTTVSSISNFGLMEMTRKRTRQSLYSAMTEPCPYCDGKGFIKSKAAVADEIFKAIEEEAKSDISSEIIYCKLHKDLELYLKEEEYDTLMNLQKRLNKEIVLLGQQNYHIEEYELSSS